MYREVRHLAAQLSTKPLAPSRTAVVSHLLPSPNPPSALGASRKGPPPISGLDLVTDSVSQSHLDQLARIVRLLRRPVPECASAPVAGQVVPAHASQDREHGHITQTPACELTAEHRPDRPLPLPDCLLKPPRFEFEPGAPLVLKDLDRSVRQWDAVGLAGAFTIRRLSTGSSARPPTRWRVGKLCCRLKQVSHRG